MIKVIPPDSWDFGEEPLRLVKVAASGLRGHDLDDLVKRSDHELADWVKHAIADGKKMPGEVWAHAIAMGSHENSGYNRNFDTWFEDDLKKDAHTFETLGRAFRQHQNSDPKKSYGVIKKAHYNDAMRRVEIILAYNATKEAAARNEGLVADKEVDDLEANRSFQGSMSTKISHDCCLLCNNKSKTRAEYCDTACPGGGMKKHAGRTLEDGRTVVVSNHDSRFFDYSRVHRHADRTAAVLGKVASHVSEAVCGAELAERLGLSCPWWLMDSDPADRDVLSRIKIARDLSTVTSLPSEFDLAFQPFSSLGALTLPQVDNDRERAQVLKSLALEKVALTIQDWLTLIAGPEAIKVASEVIAAYPAARASATDDPNFVQYIRDASFHSGPVPYYLQKWAATQTPSVITHDHLSRRIWQSVIRGVEFPAFSKTAANVSPTAKELAKRYLAYQVNFLDITGADNFSLECAARGV